MGEKNHSEALANQDALISPDEHAKRSAAKKEAQEGLEAAKAKLEAKKERMQKPRRPCTRQTRL